MGVLRDNAEAVLRNAVGTVRRGGAPGDVVFVVAEQNRNWVLGTICRELAARVEGEARFVDGTDALPAAGAYYFSHYLLFLRRRYDAVLRRRPAVVLFTHPGYADGDEPRIVRGLRLATAVSSLSTVHADRLVAAGLSRRKVAVVLPGADPEVFVGHERGEGAVGLCSAYYERKAPGTVVELVRAMPHRRFRLLGPGWRGTPEFAALEMMPNFEYSELPYEQYPSWYRGIDVFLSPSDLEGGPIPLLEAMMANAVPVATRTGIAPDVIRHGENGFLCEPGVAAPDLAALVDRAYDLAGPVRPTVEHLTWDRFAQMTPVLGRVTAP